MGDASPSPVGPGSVIAERYEIEQELGAGGMGVVLAGRDLVTERAVAIKVMARGQLAAPESVRRFRREARAARALDSPYVTRVWDEGQLASGEPFIVMERLRGSTLADVVHRQGPLPIERAIDYVLQACEGLAEAHARGIVHRDLKPSNLFLASTGDDERVKVLDFGIAKPLRGLDDSTSPSSLTGTDAFLGSPAYMSPEQIRSPKDVDARTDIWSMGLVLCKLLTGRLPFAAETASERLVQITAGRAIPLRELRPEAPAALELALLRCLRKDPDERFQHLAELACGLAPFGPAGSDERSARLARRAPSCEPPPSSPLVNELATVTVGAAAEAPTVTQGANEATTRPVGNPAALTEQPGASDGDDATTLLRPRTKGGGTTAKPVSLPSPVYGQEQPAPRRRHRLSWLMSGIAVTIVAVLAAWRLAPAQPPVEVAHSESPANPAGEVGESARTVVSISLEIEPPEARAWLDGQLVSDDPLRLPKDGRMHDLAVAAPGYVRHEQQFVANDDQALRVVLQPARAHSAGSAVPPKPPPRQPRPASTALLGPLESTL